MILLLYCSKIPRSRRDRCPSFVPAVSSTLVHELEYCLERVAHGRCFAWKKHCRSHPHRVEEVHPERGVACRYSSGGALRTIDGPCKLFLGYDAGSSAKIYETPLLRWSMILLFKGANGPEQKKNPHTIPHGVDLITALNISSF